MREPSHGDTPWRTLKSHQEDIDACPRVANKSVGNIGGTGYYYTNVICVFAMANFVLQLCNPRYSGEYIINYISLLIISILPSIWSYILKECQVLVEETEAETQS